MRDLFRAYCARLFVNVLFIGGNVLAFIITFFVTLKGKDAIPLGPINSDFDCAMLASLGIPAFFSLFTALFLWSEYSGGAIRNKLISGRTRKQIYLASYMTMALAVFIMTTVWAAAAVIAANDLPPAGYVTACIVKAYFYNLANIAFLVLVSMNVPHGGWVTVIEFMSFQTALSAAVFMQALISRFKGVVHETIRYTVNMIPYGQWLSLSALAEDDIKTSTPVQLCLSLAVLAVMNVTGIILLEKKDIK